MNVASNPKRRNDVHQSVTDSILLNFFFDPSHTILRYSVLETHKHLILYRFCHGSHRECQPSRHTFLHLLKAGSLFTLSGFDVTRCNQNIGLTDTSLTIRFSDSITVVELNERVSPIPQERLRFHAHDLMYGLANINTHLPDYALIILLEGFQGDPRVVVATINPKIVRGKIGLSNSS
ncbi:hypothetical protein Bca52824_048446 [Brassica carinata]|uniref:Uncharacterized protein n=1 Tax=Brassica carinata TaxID=52824 RepID=A0A8X7US68_BRACI|nr:hypothetical protein Bca52824_048446 [Brassica carinata]